MMADSQFQKDEDARSKSLSPSRKYKLMKNRNLSILNNHVLISSRDIKSG